MKTTKRILSTLLALLLALALLAPAMAAEEPEIIERVLPAPFVFLSSSENLKLVIDVEMSADGETWELAYAWYDYAYVLGLEDQAPPIATGATLDIPITYQYSIEAEMPLIYSAVVSRVTQDDNGEPLLTAVAVYSSEVLLVPRLTDMLGLYWEYALDIGGSPFAAIMILVFASPFILPFLLFAIPNILMMRFEVWMLSLLL